VKIEPSTEFRAKLLEDIATQEFQERTGVHCSDLIYCVLKQALRRIHPEQPSDDTILLFSLGWATQRWLTGKDEDEPEIELDGIKVTKDAMHNSVPWELKASYQSSERPIEDNIAWLRQIMAQCYTTGTTEAYLSRFEIMGNWRSIFGKKDEKKLPENRKPTLGAYRLTFTKKELSTNWEWLLRRKKLFVDILQDGKPRPRPLVLGDGTYECQYCQFKGNLCPEEEEA